MGLVTSSGFANQTITIIEHKTIVHDDFTTESQWVEGASYPACIYSKRMGMAYFGTGLWTENTLFVAMIDYTKDTISMDSKVRFTNDQTLEEEEYAIEYIDDVAFQHEALFIGLRAVR